MHTAAAIHVELLYWRNNLRSDGGLVLWKEHRLAMYHLPDGRPFDFGNLNGNLWSALFFLLGTRGQQYYANTYRDSDNSAAACSHLERPRQCLQVCKREMIAGLAVVEVIARGRKRVLCVYHFQCAGLASLIAQVREMQAALRVASPEEGGAV